MTAEEFLAAHPGVTQESERLFVREFLYPLLGGGIEKVEPQRVFIDRSGSSRRIDFAFVDETSKLALEVNGETYHAEGIIPDQMFDENLFRQNEILAANYRLIRFSYSQLQAQKWRPLVMDSLREFFTQFAPQLLKPNPLEPNSAQVEALQALQFFRDVRGYRSGVVVLPTGTGKTVLSAMDAYRVGGRVLFLVHRLDILKQSIDAFRRLRPTVKAGMLTGEVREHQYDSDVLFASKDTLRNPSVLLEFARKEFSYIIVDEVHHGQSPSYREIISYFEPKFMLGMTATPDRTDRQDILELFDYRKIYELALSDAIDRGMLVPYTYCGLTDDIDYTKIRFQGNRYRTDDLERALIIPERNEAILQAYCDRGGRNKAVGFCVSIKHAERMAEFFETAGIVAVAIHSESPDRDELLRRFRANEIEVVFTVDLFNEGIDIPNLKTLLFLRPTESKTIFLQQLGRGLRLCAGKDRVTVLDFIGNYKRANQVRKYLAKSTKSDSTNADGRTRKKFVYTYSTGCEVLFDAKVEEILTRQDEADIEAEREDLKEAYFVLAEQLGHKPSKADLDLSGEFRSALYVQKYGSWRNFLQDIEEYTEAGYAYPQGVHPAHLLAILYYFSDSRRARSPFADKFIRLRGGLGAGRLGTYQRQVKYKVTAAMEFGIITDDRKYQAGEINPLVLTPLGEELAGALGPLLDTLDLRSAPGNDGIPSSKMRESDEHYIASLRDYIEKNRKAREVVYRCFLSVQAVQQMLTFIYGICQRKSIPRKEIYQQFGHAPFVQQYCDQEGIEAPTGEAAAHRLPFLLNILDSLGCLQSERSQVVVSKVLLTPSMVQVTRDDDPHILVRRLHAVKAGWPADASKMLLEDLTAVKELFGASFMTGDYPIGKIEIFEVQ